MNRRAVLERLKAEHCEYDPASEQWPDNLAAAMVRQIGSQLPLEEVSAQQLYQLAQCLAQTASGLQRMEDTLYALGFTAEGEPPNEFYYVIRRYGTPLVVTANQLRHQVDLSELETGPFFWESDAVRAKQALRACDAADFQPDATNA